MTGHAIKANAVVGKNGTVEVTVPLPAGTTVEVMVFAPDRDDGRDLIAAAASSTDFWDNPIDDEVWNDAGTR
jgi:hypothetical protein